MSEIADEEERWVSNGEVAEAAVAGDGDQHGVRHADSGAELCAGSVAGGFDYGFGDCVSDCGADAEGGGLLRVSDAAAVADAVSAVAESGIEPEDSAAWT